MTAARTILAADDDAEWRDLIAFALQKAGYRVVLAENGKSVLPLAEKARPDCFVLDHDMGDLTGAQVCSAIKADPSYQAVPVIMLTAHAAVLPDLIAGTPPDHFVVKTGSTDELLVILEGIFTK
jgi:CheY-like chemotaxis protein